MKQVQLECITRRLTIDDLSNSALQPVPLIKEVKVVTLPIAPAYRTAEKYIQQDETQQPVPSVESGKAPGSSRSIESVKYVAFG